MVLSAVRELTVISVIIRILCAVILGGVLGFERGLKNRPLVYAPTFWCVWVLAL